MEPVTAGRNQSTARPVLQADTPTWSDLPLDIAAHVLRRLPRPPRHRDRAHFIAVCRQWRDAARESPALPRHFPWLALPDRSFYSLPAWAFQPLPVQLKQHRQLPHAQSSCGEWLVFERNDGLLTLMSPFSAATMVLPAIASLRDPDKPFKFVRGMRRPTIRKLVVVSDKLVAATVVDETRLDNVVVRLALCEPCTFWWTLATGTNSIFNTLQDIVLYKGQLYGISIYRVLFSISISISIRGVPAEPVVSRVDRVVAPPSQLSLFKAALPCYLVESNGTLLMIYRRRELQDVVPEEAAKFVVFVANFKRSRWKRADCNTELLEAVLDDRVLFLGRWCCRSVRIFDHHIDMGGNSIVFFSDDDHGDDDDYHRKRVPFYCSIYDIKTGRSQSLLQMSVQPLKGFQPTWLFPPSQA